MRPHRLAALVALVALEAINLPACVSSTPEADATASPAPSPERVSEPSGPEPIGEAPQPMGHVGSWYGSKDFPFEDWIKDDGEDGGGGMQRSVTSLGFEVLHGIRVVYEWDCPIEIDVPKRTKLLGEITRSRASLWTAQAADLEARLPMDSRDPDEWRYQGEAYCRQLYPRVQNRLNMHEGLGARVHRP